MSQHSSHKGEKSDDSETDMEASLDQDMLVSIAIIGSIALLVKSLLHATHVGT